MRLCLKKYLLPCLSAFLASIAVTATVDADVVHSSSLWQLIQNQIDGMGIDRLVIVLALMAFFLKYRDLLPTAGKWITHVLAILFAVFMLIGMSYTALNSWDFLFGSSKSFLFSLILLTGFFVLFDTALCVLYQQIERISLQTSSGQMEKSIMQKSAFGGSSDSSDDSVEPLLGTIDEHNPDTGHFRFRQWAGEHFFLCSFLIICICWLPYLLYNLPGSVTVDGLNQIRMGFRIYTLTNHHPWLLSVLYSLLMRAGSLISDNFGVFLIVAIMYVIEALCYAQVCTRIRKWGGGDSVYLR